MSTQKESPGLMTRSLPEESNAVANEFANTKQSKDFHDMMDDFILENLPEFIKSNADVPLDSPPQTCEFKAPPTLQSSFHIRIRPLEDGQKIKDHLREASTSKQQQD